MVGFDAASLTLDYPLFACDFDPLDPNRLVIGGGGGVSKTGVGNKIVSSWFRRLLPLLVCFRSEGVWLTQFASALLVRHRRLEQR
jgi:hypothetical protein